MVMMEKRYFVLLFWMLLGTGLLQAQEVSSHLFDEFQDATVYMKGNVRSEEKMNYDLLANKFIFLNRENGQINEVANPQDIVIIRIGDRSFYQEDRGGIEIIQLNDATSLYVQYMVTSKVEPPKGAYGTSSETSSITSYSGVYKETGRVEFSARKLLANSRYQIYWIEKDNKKKQFKSFKQFMKIYSKHKNALENYIQENKIRFGDVAMIKQLCLYAESL